MGARRATSGLDAAVLTIVRAWSSSLKASRRASASTRPSPPSGLARTPSRAGSAHAPASSAVARCPEGSAAIPTVAQRAPFAGLLMPTRVMMTRPLAGSVNRQK